MQLKQINYYRSNHGITSLKLMEEKMAFVPISFHFLRGHFLVEEYNEIIRRLRDAGITDFWYNFLIRKNEKVEPSGSEVLTLDHLYVGFAACIFPLALSIVTFIFELLTDFISRRVVQKVFASLKREIGTLIIIKDCW